YYIGKGAVGEVFKIVESSQGRFFAKKIIKDGRDAWNEIFVLAHILKQHNRHLLEIYSIEASDTEPASYSIIMEYGYGSLRSYMDFRRARNDPFSHVELMAMAYQLSEQLDL